MIKNFSITPFPKIFFGQGELLKLPEKLAKKFNKVTILTGGKFLQKSPHFSQFCQNLSNLNIAYSIEKICSEPTPFIIDEIVKNSKTFNPQAIVAIGGGSVLDAGKAVAAMITVESPIINFLEGIGKQEHPGTTLPFIAIPTTAGTGSETTKNAVISEIGEKGFKKSLRHDNFIPTMAIIDPILMSSCPPSVTAACGLDALTQLIESYVSNIANPMTDSLAFNAIEKVIFALPKAVSNGENDLEARADMAYGAMISGITLANVGLGVIHGFASPIGAFFDIPHGVVCGTLLPAALELNIEKLKRQNNLAHQVYLQKHLKIARIFKETLNLNDDEALNFLIQKFYHWIEEFHIPKLGKYGVCENDFQRIIKNTGLKNNPVFLDEEDLLTILKKRT